VSLKLEVLVSKQTLPCRLQFLKGEKRTLTGMQGYSGQVAATASAPSVFVLWPIPTKNSLPVKRTSDPESLASEDSRSTTVRPRSFFRTALTERQSCTLAVLSPPPPFSFGLSLVFDFGSSWSSSTPGRQIKAIPLCVTAQSLAAHGEVRNMNGQ